MGAEIPKQFIEINGKPIIVYCLDNTAKSTLIDKIIIVCNQQYIDYLNEVLKRYGYADKVDVVGGGQNRLGSAVNGVKHIQEKYGISAEDVFVAHDSVRIFTSPQILDDNIQKAKEYGAATTTYYLEETVVEADEEGLLHKSYPRENRYSDQSPQTFNIRLFMGCYEKLTEAQKASFTDLAEVLFTNDKKVYPIVGEKGNLKITTPIDLTLAKLRLGQW